MNKVEELRHYFNTAFGLNGWPNKFEVSAELYGRICQALIDHKKSIKDYIPMTTYDIVEFKVGKKGGVMFKNVELIIKGEA